MNKQEALFEYCLRLADNNLIIGHRLSEWCGHGPILEEDIAMINIALDLIGQSRTIYQYAVQVEGKGRTEDDLAYLRDAVDFKNFMLVEQPNGDFAQTMVRQLFFSTHQYFLYESLQKSADKDISAIAEKSLKEITYHLRHVSEWIVRLGDGTEESKQRTQKAVNDLWMFTGELFKMTEADEILLKESVSSDLNEIKKKWDSTIAEVFKKATLATPTTPIAAGSEVKHTEHLGHLLAEMQVLPREYPGTKW